MQIGFGAPVAGAWATPGHLAAFSEQAEEAGYASLWTFQRLLVPEGSGMDPVYRSVLDPMVALGFAAARTSRIRLGVAILNLPFVSPAYLAKQATTVDVLSGGRLDPGLGIGWGPGAAPGLRSTWPCCGRYGWTRSALTKASSTRSRRDGRIPGRCSSPEAWGRRGCSAAWPRRAWSRP